MTLKTHTLPFLLSTAVSTLALAQGPAPAAAPAPAPASAPAEAPSKRLVPEANLFELGLFGGAFFPSSKHNIQDEYKHNQAYNSAAFSVLMRMQP